MLLYRVPYNHMYLYTVLLLQTSVNLCHLPSGPEALVLWSRVFHSRVMVPSKGCGDTGVSLQRINPQGSHFVVTTLSVLDSGMSLQLGASTPTINLGLGPQTALPSFLAAAHDHIAASGHSQLLHQSQVLSWTN